MLTDEEYAWITAQIAAHDWVFAKTLAHNPHFYTLREKWSRDDDFLEMVMMIRENGHQVYFGNKLYTVIDVDGWRYWSMGAPVHETILINRRVLTDRDYEIEPQYVRTYHRQLALQEKYENRNV